MHEAQMQGGMATVELIILLPGQRTKHGVLGERTLSLIVCDRFLEVCECRRYLKLLVGPKNSFGFLG